MPAHPSTITLSNFRGLDNKNSSERLPEGFLDAIDNIDVDARGSLRTREGYTKIISGTNVHSLFSYDDKYLIYIDNGALIVYNKDTAAGVTTYTSSYIDSKVDYLKIQDRIYFSSLDYNGILDTTTNTVRPWGIPYPLKQPSLFSLSVGNLTEGIYQVVTTNVSIDGRESGAYLASTISINNNNSIQLTGIATTHSDTTISSTNIYCSTSNGDILYLIGNIPLGTSTFTISNVSQATRALASQFLSDAPKGELVSLYNGRVFLAQDNLLLYSEPHAYELFKTSSNFIQFEKPITNIMPVDDGIFITADKLYFLEGHTPETFRLREREPYGGIKRTAVKIVGSDIVLENIPTGFKWLFSSTKGIVMVGSGGMVFNLTEKSVMLDKSDEGAAIFKSQGGINQYLSVLKDPDNTRLHVGDSVSAEIIRNGITIT